MLDAAWLIPAFPLAGFVLLVAFGRRMGEPAAGWLATLASAGAFVSTVVVYAGLVGEPAEERFHIQTLFTWVESGSFSVDAGLLIDPLSVTMSLFITGVGTLIHLYSIGYMHGDPNFSKFFTYLNLFITSMLVLVLGDNLLLTFLGWEGVGACSYLLISFWFTDEGNASAGKKAFVTNRIGDFGFMLATFLVFTELSSIRYADILTRSPEIGTFAATLIVVLFLLGAAGKSAQLPLFVWLPDAMAGPTPVSALIHAATMVTSGVFLLTRLNPILAEADTWSRGLVAWVGAGTALFAATVAIAQTDIKRVLAYSTVSQLGYLFLAVGVGGYVAAIFHMVTHAFFKALLFLGSGSVIHGLHDEQDMRRMGGLARYMPLTAGTFIVGWLAIAGVPPFSGFWSKDEILLYAWNADEIGGKGLWAVGIVTALLTAFYMTRQVILTFLGRSRFYDVTAAEVAAAQAARVEAAQARVTVAQEARTAAVEQAEKAQADIVKRQEGLAKAQATLSESGAAVTASTVGADGHDKLVKALEKATRAVPKAEEALVKAREGAATTADGVVAAGADVDVATARLNDLSSAPLPLPPAVVTARTPATDVGDLTEHLPESYQHRQHYRPHESPWTMTLPLVVLALFALGAGALNLPFASEVKFLEHWLEPSLFGHEAELTASAGTKWLLAMVAAAIALVAIVTAFAVYLRGRAPKPESIELEPLAHAWYVDESYADFFGGPGRKLFDLVAWFDRTVVDGLVRGTATGIGAASRGLRVTQPGFVRSYALGLAVGAAFVMVWFLGRLFA
ncbi:MAG: NADH-quinone oxidoreductase subunit L [Acidimicrobiales bacterium]